MKRFLLLLAAVGLVSCTETQDEGGPNEIPSQLEQLQKRFDFSGVDYENLNIVAIYDGDKDGENLRQFRFPNTTIIRGWLYDCVWVGVFENATGRRLFEYIDSEPPISGSECVGEVYGIYFDEETCVLIMQYPNGTLLPYHRLDFIVLKEDSILRSIIDENALCAPSSDEGIFNRLAQWTDGILCTYYVDTLILYDVAKNELLCKIAKFNSPYSSEAETLFFSARDSEKTNLFVSSNNPFHCFYISIADRTSIIREYKLEYNVCFLSNKIDIEIFEYDKAASCTSEFKIKTRDHALAVVVQTKDKIQIKKSLDVRLEDGELKFEVKDYN